jgi:hypothetical protein
MEAGFSKAQYFCPVAIQFLIAVSATSNRNWREVLSPRFGIKSELKEAEKDIFNY